MPADRQSPIPTFDEMVERVRREFERHRLAPTEVAMERALTAAGVPELLERLAKVEAENRDLWEIAHVPTLLRDRMQMRERLERYETALRFYADEDNWFWRDGIGRPSAHVDDGRRARAALPSPENRNDDERTGSDGRE